MAGGEGRTPYRDGTTHVIIEPLDFIAKLVALVPPPCANSTRFRGVFAPNSRYRARLVLGRGNKRAEQDTSEDTPTLAERCASMTWVQRLRRVFDIDTCPACGGAVRIIACIEDPDSSGSQVAHFLLPVKWAGVRYRLSWYDVTKKFNDSTPAWPTRSARSG